MHLARSLARNTISIIAAASFAGCAGSSARHTSASIHSVSVATDPSHSIIIHQEVDFTAPPERVYEALLDSKQFAAFSGRPAEINREAGGAFSIFGAHIVGRNIELVPNRRIVQAWRVVPWNAGEYSIARFDLKPEGPGTHLTFDHIGFPEGQHDHLAEGWEANYWSLLKKYFR